MGRVAGSQSSRLWSSFGLTRESAKNICMSSSVASLRFTVLQAVLPFAFCIGLLRVASPWSGGSRFRATIACLEAADTRALAAADGTAMTPKLYPAARRRGATRHRSGPWREHEVDIVLQKLQREAMTDAVSP